MWVDFTYYTDNYKGTLIPETSFDYYSQKSQDYIIYYTLSKVQTYFNENLFIDNIKKAVCSVAEAQYRYDESYKKLTTLQSSIFGSGIKQETVKSHSITMMSAKELQDSFGTLKTTLESEINESINYYLLTTGLLYRGVCYVR